MGFGVGLRVGFVVGFFVGRRDGLGVGDDVSVIGGAVPDGCAVATAECVIVGADVEPLGKHEFGGLADMMHICWSIQSMTPLIRAYTPGNPALAQPLPNETTPI